MYKLINSENKEIRTTTPGFFGGNSKLKIYGKLDCKNALMWISKGHYVKNRVFFVDMKTAEKAGYRPCAKCLTTEYNEWKNNVR